MDRCMTAAEWSTFSNRRAQSERNDKLRGIGMATYTERCGGGFPETASIEFKDERVELVMDNQDMAPVSSPRTSSSSRTSWASTPIAST
jgi:carbon-monoxide dehydrogenase large subunit